MKNMEKKEKIPIIITILNLVTHLIPIFVFIPLLWWTSKIETHILVTVNMLLFLVILAVYAIGIFLAPLIQLILMIIAIINKKWRLMWVHIVSEILFCGGIVLFLKIAERVAQA